MGYFVWYRCLYKPPNPSARMTEGNLYFMLMKIYVFLAVYKKVR